MRTEYCILNGDIIKSEDARVSPFDRGFMYGDGVFDTIFAPKGVPFLFDEHITRLFDGMLKIGISMPHSKSTVYNMLTELVAKNALTGVDAYLRITVTRGKHSGKMYHPSFEPTLFVIAVALPESIISARENGISCVISEVPKCGTNPICGIKSLNFLWSILGMRQAIESNANECLFFNSDGYLAEGATSNVFIIKNGAISTPALDSGILPGVTRGYLIKLLRQGGMPVSERRIREEELLDADEVFITSAIRGVVAVNIIDDFQYRVKIVNKIKQLYFSSIV